MTRLLRPAVTVMNHLSYAQKLLLIGLLFITPFAMVTFLLIQEANRQIEFKRNECNGLEYTTAAIRFLHNLRKCRMYSAAIRAGHDYQRDLAETKAAADSLVPFIDGLDARFKKSFQAEDGSYPCSDRWKSIVNDWRSIQPEHNGTKIYTELCIEVREWILRDIGNHSNLNLDSELDSTWMIDALVSKLPAIGKDTGRACALCIDISSRADHTISNEEHLALTGLYANANENIDALVDLNMRMVFKFTGESGKALERRIGPLVEHAVRDARESLESLKQILLSRQAIVDVDASIKSSRMTLDAIDSLSNTLEPELHSMIEARLGNWVHKRNLALAAACVAVLLLAYVFAGFFYSVERSIVQLEIATQRMIAGTTQRFHLESRDELGRIADSYNQINAALVETRALKESIEKARHLAEESKKEAERQTSHLAEEVLERRETERRLNIQNAITRTLAESTTFEKAAPRILASIGEFVHGELCNIWQIDNSGTALRATTVWMRTAAYESFAKVTRELSFAKGIGLPGRVWSGGKSTWITDVCVDDNFPRKAAAIQAGLRGAYGFPVTHGGNMHGVIELFCRDVLRPDEKFLRLMTDIASQLGQFMGRERAQRERKILEVQLLQAQKLESIGQLAAGIAHEINTPTQYIGDNTRFVKDSFSELQTLLTAYASFVSKAHDGKVDVAALEAVEAAQKSADVEYLLQEIPNAVEQTLEGIKRVSEIVGAMKEFSHPGKEEKTRIDLNHAISNTITVARNEWKYVADIHTDFKILPLVPCLPGAFNQVILNLVVNAAQAIGEVVAGGDKGKGTITISTRCDRDQVEIRIHDTGKGIPKAIHPRIFEPFFTTKDVGKGTGQGLAIARSVICDKHGGSIHFESEENKGTTFIIRMPLDEPSASPSRIAIQAVEFAPN